MLHYLAAAFVLLSAASLAAECKSAPALAASGVFALVQDPSRHQCHLQWFADVGGVATNVSTLEGRMQAAEGLAVVVGLVDTMLVTAQHNTLYSLDPASGAVEAIGRLGVDNITAIATKGPSVLWVLSGESHRLFSFDLDTRAWRQVHSQFLSRYRLEDLAVGSAGDGFVLVSNPPRLLQVNLVTAEIITSTLVGSPFEATALASAGDDLVVAGILNGRPALQTLEAAKTAAPDPQGGTRLMKVSGLAVLDSPASQGGGPHLDRADPTSGGAWETVTVFGSGFGIDIAAVRVFLGSVECPVEELQDSLLVLHVPEAATSGPLTVSTPDGTSHLPFVLSPLLARSAPTPGDITAGFLAGRIIIKYRQFPPDANTLSDVSAAYGLAMQQELTELGAHIAYRPGADHDGTVALAESLLSDPRLEWASVNGMVSSTGALGFPDPNFRYQVHLGSEFMNLEAGLSALFPLMGHGVTIGVIEDNDLGNSVEVRPVAKVEYGMPIISDLGHAAAVASTAAARSNTFCGIGVAPEADIAFVRAATAVDVARGIRWCIRRNVRVINMSFAMANPLHLSLCGLGGVLSPRIVDEAIVDADGTVLCAASGNSGGGVDYPACHPSVVAVGSIDFQKMRSTWSGFGPALDFVAFAEGVRTEDIMSSEHCGDWQQTSFAVPQYAGLAALILAQQPTLNPTQLRDQIQEYFVQDVNTIGRDDQTGHGMLRIPVLRLESLSPANGSTVSGGPLRPRAVIGPLIAGLGPNTLEFFVNNVSAGSIMVRGVGTYVAPNAVLLPNVVGRSDAVTIRAVLTQGPPAYANVSTMTSQVTTAFDPEVAFFYQPWHVEFQSTQDWTTFIRSWSGSGRFDGLTGAGSLSVTVFDGYTGETRTCSPVGTAVAGRFARDTRYWRYDLFLGRCIPSMANQQYIFTVFDSQNPAMNYDGTCPGGELHTTLVFDDVNLKEIRIIRSGCNGYEDLFVLTRDTPSGSSQASAVNATPILESTIVGLDVAPNPVLGSTTFSLNLPSNGPAELSILDLQGRVVRRLVHRGMSGGTHKIVWDARDSRGALVRPGSYFAVLRSGEAKRTRVVVVVR